MFTTLLCILIIIFKAYCHQLNCARARSKTPIFIQNRAELMLNIRWYIYVCTCLRSSVVQQSLILIQYITVVYKRAQEHV